jgi:hyaluronoglucosaminidase
MIGHRLIIWDNYPVNDAHPTLHLGPVTHRDLDLCEVVDGYMANPLCPQNEINRLPLITEADYAYNPWGYDPARSIGQAIVHLARSADQRAVLKDLVELYPGMLIEGSGRTDLNPVIEGFKRLQAGGMPRSTTDSYLARVQDVADRLGRAFPGRFADARETVTRNLEEMRRLSAKGPGQ